MDPLGLDQVVHLVKELRQLLDLVDHDHRRIRRSIGAALRHHLAQSRRILRQRQILAAAQEVYEHAGIELRAQQHGLASASRTEQKQRLALGELPHVQGPLVHATQRNGAACRNQRRCR